MIIVGSSLHVVISIGESIGVGASAVIKFLAPTSGAGTWAATIDDAALGTISHDAVPGDIAEVGTWYVWAVYTLADGRVWKTPAQAFTVYAEGTVQR